MNRKTIIALLLFFGLLAAVYLIQSQPQKGERQGEKPRPFSPLAADSIKQVTIEKGQHKVVLAKTNDAWQLTAPVRYPADKYASETMATKLEQLEFGDIVTERKEKRAEYAVDEKSGIHVVVSDGKKTVADFFLGKELDGFTMLRASGKDQVFQAVGSLRPTFDRETKSWRDRSIVKLPKDDTRKLTVESEAGTITLTRQDDKSPWQVEHSSTPIEKLDEDTVNRLLSTLGNLVANDFADGISPQDSGLQLPAAKITVKQKEGEPISLLLGQKKGEDRYLQRAGQPQVYLLGQYPQKNLIKRPQDFRDKTVLSFKAEDVESLTLRKKADTAVESVTLTRKGEKWQAAGKPLIQAQNDRVKRAAEALASLKAEGFALEGPASYGLDSPQWTVEIQLKDRTRHKLLVGGQESGGLMGLSRVGSKDVFTFRKHQLDRFLFEPNSLK